ncbi:DUF6660 family protein [Spirosoma koreense]
MKAVIYLFAWWLLLLSGLPCPDAECHARHTGNAATSASLPTDDQDHEHPCSPFCHCATCLGFSVPQSFGYTLPTTAAVLTSSRQAFAYQLPSHAGVARSVWQPPQLRI